MVELNAACCPAEIQNTCCEPEAKADCCDQNRGSSCGCSVGTTGETQTATRESHSVPTWS